MEVNYNNWIYSTPALTVCTDYVNHSFIDEYYKRAENITSIDKNSATYHDYQRYMKIIGSLNAENIHLIDEFDNSELFKNLSGDQIYNIALNV